MPIKRFDSGATADEIRALSPVPPREQVEEIIEAVRERGDTAVAEIEGRFGGSPGRVPAEEISSAPSVIETDLLEALKLSIANVRSVAAAALPAEQTQTLDQGQQVTYRTIPVRRVATYVPGGRGSYPSTAIMCLATAVEAGVERICVLSPARENGEVDRAVLAVCALLGVDEVHSVGGAQAVAAAALGTDSIEAVDVVVGPGNAFVQEAKRQLVGRIGIDSVAGPSELVVVADSSGDAELISLDLLAQGEHGPDSLVVLISTNDELLADVGGRCAAITAELALVKADDLGQAVALSDAIAPEHMQLMVAPGIEDELAASVRNAGALFVGKNAATAFGDYVTGSNHVLPTGGSARFSSALSVSTFRRRMAEIRVPDSAVAPLAEAGATIARAEGFAEHAKSMEARNRD